MGPLKQNFMPLKFQTQISEFSKQLSEPVKDPVSRLSVVIALERPTHFHPMGVGEDQQI